MNERNDEPDLIATVDQVCEESKQVARVYTTLYRAYLDEGLTEDVARAFVCAAIAGRIALGK